MSDWDEELERKRARLNAEELIELIEKKIGGSLIKYLWWMLLVVLFAIFLKVGILTVRLPTL